MQLLFMGPFLQPRHEMDSPNKEKLYTVYQSQTMKMIREEWERAPSSFDCTNRAYDVWKEEVDGSGNFFHSLNASHHHQQSLSNFFLVGPSKYRRPKSILLVFFWGPYFGASVKFLEIPICNCGRGP